LPFPSFTSPGERIWGMGRPSNDQCTAIERPRAEQRSVGRALQIPSPDLACTSCALGRSIPAVWTREFEDSLHRRRSMLIQSRIPRGVWPWKQANINRQSQRKILTSAPISHGPLPRHSSLGRDCPTPPIKHCHPHTPARAGTGGGPGAGVTRASKRGGIGKWDGRLPHVRAS
jgi:hypothetical protein